MQGAAVLIERVRGIVGDKSLVPRIFEHLNDGLAQVCRVVRPPDLQKTASVSISAGDSSASLPEDFFGPRVFEARNLTTDEPIHKRHIYYRNAEFVRDNPTIESGPVEAILIRGSRVWVAGIPTVEEEIQLKYQGKPTYFEDMDDDGSEILYLPERLGEKALVYYAAMEEFRLIEDGVDGDKRNMADAKSVFLETLGEIAAHFGTENLEDGGPVMAHDTLGLLSGDPERDLLWGRL